MFSVIGIQYDYYKLDVRAHVSNHKGVYGTLGDDDKQLIDTCFGNTPNKLKGKYMDAYEGIESEILYTTKFDENSDFGTTH